MSLKKLQEINPTDANTMLFYGHALLANDLFADTLNAWIKADKLVPQSILIIQQDGDYTENWDGIKMP